MITETSAIDESELTTRSYSLPPSVWLAFSVGLFYWFTAAPSLVWADGGRLQTEAITGRSIYLSFPEFDPKASDGWPLDRLGVAAWDHPLWVMIGHGVTRLPGGDQAHRLNLLSGAIAVAAVVVFFHLMNLIVDSRLGAVAGAACLAVSHTFWFHAVTAEVYTLHVLFMGSLLLLALTYQRTRRWGLLVVLSLLAGLGMANHVMLALTAVPVALFLVFEKPSGHVPASERTPPQLTPARMFAVAAAFVAGLAPWWIQFLRMAQLVGFRTTALMAIGLPWLAGRFPGPLGPGLIVNVVEYVVMLMYQFTPVGVALGVLGFFELRRRSHSVARLLLVLFVLHAGFSANYDVPDRFTFHITSYAIFAIFIASGVSRLIELLRRSSTAPGTWWMPESWSGSRTSVLVVVALVTMPVVMYSLAPRVVVDMGLADELAVPDVGRGARDGVRYFLNPYKRGDTSATTFGRGALDAVRPNAVVIAAWPGDQESYIMLRHFQLVERMRPDVHLDLALFAEGSSARDRVRAIVDQQAPCRPVYLASMDPDLYPLDWIESRYDVEPDGMLYRLVSRSPHAHAATACPSLPGSPLSPTELVDRATHA